MLRISEEWRKAYPEAVVGILAMGNVSNPSGHPELDERKTELERGLRDHFGGRDRAELRAIPPLDAYHAYFKRFKKTYPVQLQLESVVYKKQSIPHVSALVEAMFMAELSNLLLTAAHDLETIEQPLTLDASQGNERYTRLNGSEQDLKAGDMIMKDGLGIIASVAYGPDWRTRLTESTRRVLFVTYGVPGISADAIREHLEDIQTNVRLLAPEAETELVKLYGAHV